MYLRIQLGPLASPLKDQLKDAKVRAHYKDVARWQSYADAINQLYVNGLLSESDADKSRRKLVRFIIAGVIDG